MTPATTNLLYARAAALVADHALPLAVLHDLHALLCEAQAQALEDAALSGCGLLSEWQAGWLCELACDIRGEAARDLPRPPEDRTAVLMRMLRDIHAASADPRVATAGPDEITRPMRAVRTEDPTPTPDEQPTSCLEIRATYGTGAEDECVACGLLTTRWSHGVTSYPLCPICATEAQREADDGAGARWAPLGGLGVGRSGVVSAEDIAMTPYQRGQRDGLLAVAAELDDIEKRQAAEAEAWTRRDHPGSQRQVEIWTAWASGTRDAAAICRRRAESLPHDPEETP